MYVAVKTVLQIYIIWSIDYLNYQFLTKIKILSIPIMKPQSIKLVRDLTPCESGDSSGLR